MTKKTKSEAKKNLNDALRVIARILHEDIDHYAESGLYTKAEIESFNFTDALIYTHAKELNYHPHVKEILNNMK